MTCNNNGREKAVSMILIQFIIGVLYCIALLYTIFHCFLAGVLLVVMVPVIFTGVDELFKIVFKW